MQSETGPPDGQKAGTRDFLLRSSLSYRERNELEMMERLVAILKSRERSICFNDADRRECRWLLCLLLLAIIFAAVVFTSSFHFGLYLPPPDARKASETPP